MFNKKPKVEKWFKILNKKYFKNKLDYPYSNLFYYFTYAVYRPYFKSKRCKSHYYLFFLAKEGDYLGEIIRDLRAILPRNLYDNFSDALEHYNNVTEGLDCDDLDYNVEKELVASFKKYDDYVNEYSNSIENILKNLV